jgi:transposase-like protein
MAEQQSEIRQAGSKTARPPAELRLADPQVELAGRRRVFTAEYKARVLAEADRCGPGELGALLRREGLYSSHLTDWRRQREAGGRAGLEPKKRGRKAAPGSRRIAELERELERTRDRLRQAEAIVDAQKKLALLLALAEAPKGGELP